MTPSSIRHQNVPPPILLEGPLDVTPKRILSLDSHILNALNPITQRASSAPSSDNSSTFSIPFDPQYISNILLDKSKSVESSSTFTSPPRLDDEDLHTFAPPPSDSSSPLSITLSISPSFTVFSQAPLCFTSSAPEYADLVKQNMTYEATLDRYSTGRNFSLLSDHATQTLPLIARSQGLQVTLNTPTERSTCCTDLERESGDQSDNQSNSDGNVKKMTSYLTSFDSDWSITSRLFDAVLSNDCGDVSLLVLPNQIPQSINSIVEESTSTVLPSNVLLFTQESRNKLLSEANLNSSALVNGLWKSEKILHQNSNSSWVERVFLTNNDVNSSKIRQKRTYGPQVSLFSISPLPMCSSDVSATCITAQQDFLAIAYKDTSQSTGVRTSVAVYNLLQNIYAPICVIDTTSVVLSMTFPQVKSPKCLIVGLFDGNVVVIDLHRKNQIVFSSSNQNRHSAPVWAMTWQEVSQLIPSRAKTSIISLSSDGLAKSWKLTQSLESTTIMKFKSVQNPDRAVKNTSEPFINRLASPICACFESLSTNGTYLVGTTDGLVHLCFCSSTSLGEQYLATFYGHAAAIVGLTTCPFNTSFFVSADACGTSQSVALFYTEKPDRRAVSFYNTRDVPVVAVAWCPFNPKLVAVALKSGTVDLWDVTQQDSDDPVQQLRPHEHLMNEKKDSMCCITSLKFSREFPLLYIGTENGKVLVVELSDAIVLSREEIQKESANWFKPLLKL
ncbi:hypothetical protein RCL1_000694 [Eukaryota sp. TZLM3-RCL]